MELIKSAPKTENKQSVKCCQLMIVGCEDALDCFFDCLEEYLDEMEFQGMKPKIYIREPEEGEEP